MAKAVGLMLGVRKGEEESRIPVRLILTKAEKEDFAKYLQMSGGNPSEIVSLAVKRIMKYDKYFIANKEKTQVSGMVWDLLKPKGGKKKIDNRPGPTMMKR